MSEVARLLSLSPDEVLPSSTGIIGRPLAVDKITAALPGLVAQLARGERADAQAAGAIMTTDLVPKHASRTVAIGGHAVTLGAIAKGSGMIAPRMDVGHAHPRTPPSGTMLAFVTTDCAISSADLQEALDEASAGSFNSISVDNHASCSDTVITLASGASGAPTITRNTPAFRAFTDALADLCLDVSEQIVTDGEGATRIFRATVRGTQTHEQARAVAREIVNSPLVKCAIHGQDPNWGRIVTAAGNAGLTFDTQQASLLIGPVEVYRAGVPVVEALSDPRLKQAMSAKRVEIVLTLGRGTGEGAMIGCDLSKEYVSINADYTT
jgi:glutamate N-acetyltransferase/amino-acid N-acetyltransferase